VRQVRTDACDLDCGEDHAQAVSDALPLTAVPNTRQLDLLVLGDLNPDLILSGEEVQPAFGQVERLLDAAELTIGGSGAIVACGAARLGLRTAIVGVVGDDLFGRFMREALRERGVDGAAVVVDPTARTGLTVILSRPQDRAILTFPGTAAALTPSDVDRELIRTARHLHVSSFFLQTALAEGLGNLLAEARAAGASTSVDPNWDPQERWNGGLRAVLRHTGVFLPNAQEAARIAGEQDPDAAARALAAEGPLVAVKLGADGALAVQRGEITRVPPPAIDSVDATGAGDSFDAGMIAGLLAGWSIPRVLSMGCICGALSTQGVGGTAAQPTLKQALELLDRDTAASGPAAR
jgi:sugar/nucleoside kinase (ribokinase family)